MPHPRAGNSRRRFEALCGYQALAYELYVIAIVLVASSQSTEHPRFSETNLKGSIVLLLMISGTTLAFVASIAVFVPLTVATLPKKPVILTFDDGRFGVYQSAFPVLKVNGQKAILFLISSEVGRVVKGYLDWSMVKEMQDTGLITFGSHTVHHAVLPPLTTQRAVTELSYSKMIIQRNTGLRCDYFCYPHGKYDARVAKLVGAAGYRAATSEIPGWSRVADNPYELRRVRVDGRDTMADFRAKLVPGG